MNHTFKVFGIIIINLVLIMLAQHPNAQTTSKNTPTVYINSLNTVQQKMLSKGIGGHITVLDSTGFRSTQYKRNLLFSPQDKNRFNYRDLLLRPQDRNAIMIHPVQEPLAQPDTTKQEN